MECRYTKISSGSFAKIEERTVFRFLCIILIQLSYLFLITIAFGSGAFVVVSALGQNYKMVATGILALTLSFILSQTLRHYLMDRR